MGKIRVKTLGKDVDEKKEAEKAQRRREAKKQKKATAEPTIAVEAEKVPTTDTKEAKKSLKTEKVDEAKAEAKVETPVEAGAALEAATENEEGTAATATTPSISEEATKSAKKEKAMSTREAEQAEKEEKKAKKSARASKKTRHTGKNYKAAQKKVDAEKTYDVDQAIKLVKDMAFAKFDETVELHINLREEGAKGEVALPHGTGQEINVAIADDKVLAEIDGGNINFDVLIASPAFMPKLVKYARVLGPKGLMPNPKNGTVSDNPEQAAKKFKAGNVHYKSETKAPLMHQAVGKVSFKEQQLVENVHALVKAVGMRNIADVYISATMTPSVKINTEKL